jgi:hypothetical protein
MKRFFALLIALAPLFALAQNSGGTLIPSAAYTATVTSGDQDNTQFRGVHVVINVSSYTNGNFTPKIQGKDPASGTYYDILVGPAISATGATVLKVYPGIGSAANGAAQDILPKTWRVTVIGASTPSATLSVGFFYEL